MKKLTFTGIDVNLETSLCEYGLILSNESHEDGSGTHFAVYLCGFDGENRLYGCGHYSEKDIKDLLTGKDWASGKDLGDFFEFIGIGSLDIDKYIQDTPLVSKIHDLISYFGNENIMGTEYNPMTEEEAKERWLNS